MRTPTRKTRGIALLLVGMLAGMLLITPATAHFTQNTQHLGKHAWKQFIQKRVYNRKQANNRFQQKCKQGTVLAHAYVRGANLSDTAFAQTGIGPQFNCAGGPMTGFRSSTGVYRLRVPGIKTATGGTNDGLVAILTPANHIQRVMSYDIHAIHDYIEIDSWTTPDGNRANNHFTIAILRVT